MKKTILVAMLLASVLSACASSPANGPSNRETYVAARQQRGEAMRDYQQQQFNAYTNWKN